MNKVILIGRLTKDPEIKKIPSGTSVAKCSLATNKKYKDKNGEKKEEVQFHNLVIWGKTAEVFAQYLSKGSQVAVVGEIKTRNYEKDGVVKYMTEIIVSEMDFIGNNKSANSTATTTLEASPSPANEEKEVNIEDVSF